MQNKKIFMLESKGLTEETRYGKKRNPKRGLRDTWIDRGCAAKKLKPINVYCRHSTGSVLWVITS